MRPDAEIIFVDLHDSVSQESTIYMVIKSEELTWQNSGHSAERTVYQCSQNRTHIQLTDTAYAIPKGSRKLHNNRNQC